MCYVKDKFIGTTVSKKITVNIFNDGQYDLENKDISVKTGVEIDGSVEYVPMGNYIIEKPDTEETTSQTEFTGYDYMIKFNDTYEDRVSYPITAGELLEDICDQAGVECGSTEFVNSDYEIQGNPFTDNETLKAVLSNIAQLAGGFAHIGRDNKVYIKTLEIDTSLLTVKEVHYMTVEELNGTLLSKIAGVSIISDEQIDGNNYFSFKKNNMFGEVNCLVLRISGTEGENTTVQDDESIEENGETEIVIEDNYFLSTEEEREKVITNLWESLKGLKYVPFTSSYYGYPYLDVGDMLCISDTDDVEHISYVFNHTFEYDGGYSGTLETDALTETQTAYKSTNDISTVYRRTERVIDKINGQIEDIIEQQTETEEKVSQHTQDINSIKDEISSITEYTKTKSGTNQIYLDETAEGNGYVISLTIYGEMEYLTPTDTLIPANTLVPLGNHFTLVIDTQMRGSLSESAIEYDIVLEEPLRELDGVYDELIISQDGTVTVVRNIGVDTDNDLYVLDSSTTEILDTTVIIPTFEDTTYIYIKEHSRLNYSANYIISNDYSNSFATKVELSSSIVQTTEEILSTVSESYATLVDLEETEVNLQSSISQTSTSILSTVSATYATQSSVAASLELKVDTENLISEINASADVITLTSNRISITSDYFTLTEKGVVTASKLTVSNGSIEILSNGSLYIYASDGSTVKMRLRYDGLHLYNDGDYIGHIGSGVYSSSYNGLYFNLNEDGDLIGWTTSTTSSSNTTINYKLYYSKAGTLNTSEMIVSAVPIMAKKFEFSNNVNMYGATISSSSVSGSYKGFVAVDDEDNYIMKCSSGYISFTTTSVYAGGYKIELDTSDGRLKHNIKNTEVNALDRIKEMKHRQFVWNENDKLEQIGYIAQELEKIDENYVIKNAQYDENGEVVDYLYQVNLLPILATATKAIAELQTQVDNQQTLIEQLLESKGLKYTQLKTEEKEDSVDYGTEINYTNNRNVIADLDMKRYEVTRIEER